MSSTTTITVYSIPPHCVDVLHVFICKFYCLRLAILHRLTEAYRATSRSYFSWRTSAELYFWLIWTSVKPAFHDADTDTDIFADILARIVARLSVCSSACHRNNFRKSRVSDESARILASMSVSVSVSASWNSSLINTRLSLPAALIEHIVFCYFFGIFCPLPRSVAQLYTMFKRFCEPAARQNTPETSSSIVIGVSNFKLHKQNSTFTLELRTAFSVRPSVRLSVCLSHVGWSTVSQESLLLQRDRASRLSVEIW